MAQNEMKAKPALPERVRSMEARSGERRHTRTLNRVIASRNDDSRAYDFRSLRSTEPGRLSQITLSNEINNLAHGFMERVRPHGAPAVPMY